MTRWAGGGFLAGGLACMALAHWSLEGETPSEPKAPPDFAGDVIPTLTKQGCNSGACHGAALGQGGFKLSLLGYDPESDYDTITRQFGGRRVRQDKPELSLVLRKPSMQIGHGGGLRLPPDGEAFRTVSDWLAAGAEAGNLGVRVVHLVVDPPEVILGSPGDQAQFRVLAFMSDGSKRDRTDLALYTPLDETLASVSPGGRVTVLRKGVTDVMIRFGGQVASVRAAIPFNAGVRLPKLPKDANPIDDAVAAALLQYGIWPAELCTDGEFLRRASLVIAGRLPTASEARRCATTPSSNEKRAEIVDRLLSSPEFADLWAMRLSDWLLVNAKRLQPVGAKSYHAWLRSKLAAHAPVDGIVRSLIMAEGSPNQHPEANFYRLTQDPRDMGEFVSRAFMGTRMACARCHNHPFDRWTQTDYHRFAAVFATVRFDQGVVGPNPRPLVDHPKTGKPVAPSLPGAAAVLSPTVDPRKALADWLFESDLRFNRAFANLVWKHLMGRGVVEPVDDLRASNPPSNPYLLAELARSLSELKYDLRAFIRNVALSDAFQRSSQPARGDVSDGRFFSRYLARPLTGPVLADALADFTGVPTAYPGYPSGTRAVQLPDPSVESYTLDVFGRCSRDAACAADSASGGGLAEALHLLNSPELEAKVRNAAASLASMPDERLVEEVYLGSLSRLPTAREREYALSSVKGRPGQPTATRAERVEDLIWALIHSKEFGVIR